LWRLIKNLLSFEINGGGGRGEMNDSEAQKELGISLSLSGME
jgi:hypothetical protein